MIAIVNGIWKWKNNIPLKLILQNCSSLYCSQKSIDIARNNLLWKRSSFGWVIPNFNQNANSLWLWNYRIWFNFSKIIWVLLMKITAQLILNVAHHRWVAKKRFPSRLPFYLTEKDQSYILYWKTFIKIFVKELCKKIYWK